MAAKLSPCSVGCGSEADKKAAPRLEAGRGGIFIDSYIRRRSAGGAVLFLRLDGEEAQPHVVGGPALLFIEERWAAVVFDLLIEGLSLRLAEALSVACREYLQPAAEPRGKRCRSVDAGDEFYLKTLIFQNLREGSEFGVFPWIARLVIDAALYEGDLHPLADDAHAPLAAALGGETPAGLQQVPDAAHDGIMVRHPVDRGVAHDGVEFLIHLQGLRVRQKGLNAELARGGDHLRAGVRTNDGTAHIGKLFRQDAGAAAKIQNPLPRLWLKEFYHRFPEFWDEVRALPVFLWVPDLICHR